MLTTRPIGLVGAATAAATVSVLLGGTVALWVLVGFLASIAVIGSP